MFDDFKNKMALSGLNIREANKRHITQIMEDSFDKSQSFKVVEINGVKYDARIFTDSKTTVRGGLGNHTIQFRNGVYPPAGSYIQIPDSNNKLSHWLLLYESDDPLFPKSIIKKCNYLLKWKNSKGKIIERWCTFNDNARLTNGEYSEFYNKMNLPRHTVSLILPCDEETINITYGKRFLVDFKSKQELPDAWIVSNRNVVSKTFDGDNYSGIVELSLSHHQYNHLVDNRELMIADYYGNDVSFTDINTESPSSCRIVYSGNSDLKMDMPFKKYTVEFYKNGVIDNTVIGSWDVTIPPDIQRYFTHEINNNIINIKCSYNGELMGRFIRIKAYNNELNCSSEIPIKVVSGI